jgi:uncharacterized protein (TIGR02246 family)
VGAGDAERSPASLKCETAKFTKEKQMKRFPMAVFMAIFMCFIAYSQTQNKNSGKMSKTEQQVMALNRAWADAITKADATALDRLFADDMIVTAGNGGIRNKTEEIKDSAGSPDPDFIWTNPFTTEDERVKIYQDAAVVTGLAKWGFKYKGNEVNQERRYTHTYVKQKGQWRIVAQQISSNLYKKP